jgi:hypothetical protein
MAKGYKKKRGGENKTTRKAFSISYKTSSLACRYNKKKELKHKIDRFAIDDKPFEIGERVIDILALKAQMGVV